MTIEQTVVIGGGPAGLTAAYEWNKLGGRSTILEADKQVGGISKTVNYQGNRFDIGGHRFFSKVPYINQVWEEILEEEFLTRHRLSRILYKERFFDYPLKPINAISGLGLQESISVVLSYARMKALPRAQKPDDNFENWVINRFGSKLYEIFFKTYTEKVWGMSCADISADWASQRIKNFSLMEAIKNALWSTGKTKNGEVITTIIEQFKYPRLGPGMMWEHCQNFLEKEGSPTLLNHRVTAVQHRNKRVWQVIATGPQDEQTAFTGAQYISSMPLRELILRMDPLPPPEVVAAARKLRYRDYLTVVLTIERENVFPDNWIYIHTPHVKLGRIQNYKNWSEDMVADPKYTTLGLEYFLWEKDPEWTWPDDRLIELGMQECEQIGLINCREVVDGTLVRMKKAYPVYDMDYMRQVKTIKQYLSRFENLQTVGRNGLHRYNNQDHSMLTGIYAARNIVGGQHDVWSVNTEQSYHEEGQLNGARASERMFPMAVR